MRLVWRSCTAFVLLTGCPSDDTTTSGTSEGVDSSSTTASTGSTETGSSSTLATTSEASSTSAEASTTGSSEESTTSADSSSSGVTSESGGTSSTDSGETTSGDLPNGCAGIEVILLTEPHVQGVQNGAPAAWIPGGDVVVLATLGNTDDEIFTSYPGIFVESDNELVTPTGDPFATTFAVAGNGFSEPLGVTFTADAEIEPNTEVTFTIRIASTSNICPNGDSTQISAIVDSPDA